MQIDITGIDLSSFSLSLPQLCQIRDILTQRILEGMEKSNREIKALPTYLSLPNKGQEGMAIVVDTGGTNMRAALINVKPGKNIEIAAGPFEAQVPTGRDGRSITAEEFFDAQAALVKKLNPPENLPCGYCFSYPAETTPSLDAKLINWTKEVRVSGVEGTLVGLQLTEALARIGIKTSRVAVVNDTVAALLAGAGQYAGSYDLFGALIAGTGTNMAGFFDFSKLLKLKELAWNSSVMALNLESGNFYPPFLSSWDNSLDAASLNPGCQRFEKAVSGHYLPYIYCEVMGDKSDIDPSMGTKVLTDKRAQGCQLSLAILNRSNDLLAAGLAGLLLAMGNKGKCCLVAEGMRYWGDTKDNLRINQRLSQLLPKELTADIVKIHNANLVGSAFAVL